MAEVTGAPTELVTSLEPTTEVEAVEVTSAAPVSDEAAALVTQIWDQVVATPAPPEDTPLAAV